jgi:hypothetical protein
MSDDRIQPERREPSPRVPETPRTPQPEPPGDEPRELPKLGKLAHSARDKNLKQTRTTLLIVGVLMIIVQAIFFVIEVGQVRAEIQKQDQAAGGQIGQRDLKQQELIAYGVLALFHGTTIMVGCLFIVLAFFVQRYPVPISIVALALFVAVQALAAVLDPANLARGWILKIIVVVALVKSLQAGMAAQREKQAEEEALLDA